MISLVAPRFSNFEPSSRVASSTRVRSSSEGKRRLVICLLAEGVTGSSKESFSIFSTILNNILCIEGPPAVLRPLFLSKLVTPSFPDLIAVLIQLILYKKLLCRNVPILKSVISIKYDTIIIISIQCQEFMRECRVIKSKSKPESGHQQHADSCFL